MHMRQETTCRVIDGDLCETFSHHILFHEGILVEIEFGIKLNIIQNLLSRQAKPM